LYSFELTQSIAVGDKEFTEQTKARLGAKAMGRKSYEDNKDYVLKQPQNPYNRVFAPEKDSLRLKNQYFWQALP
jgi:putative transposase